MLNLRHSLFRKLGNNSKRVLTTKSNKHNSSTAFPQIPLQPLSFEDFLKADTNRDGRVTAAEWDAYVRSKTSLDSDPNFRGITVHFPLSPIMLREVLESDSFGVTINGLHYSIHLQPEGETVELIKTRKEELKRVEQKISELEASKLPLDAAAARHTRRVMSSILAYLLIQAGIVAKLTFFSRFGWDIMEPITYFITFGISLIGLTFFTWNRLEFSYPALAALIARRRAIRLYKKNGFDENLLLTLRQERDRLKRQLDSMVPAHRSIKLGDVLH